MKKKIIAIGLAMLCALSLCACDGESDIDTGKLKDVAGQYGKAIEENKEQIEKGIKDLEKIAKDAMDKVNAD